MKRVKKLFIGILGIGAIATAVGAYVRHTSSTPTTGVVAQNATFGNVSRNVQWTNISSTLDAIPNKIYYRNKVVIVTFHDISPDVYSPYVVSPAQFSADLDVLQARFHVITNQQFIDFLNHRGIVPPNAVLLTFDDGYRDMYTYALPALLQHHLQGTFFEIVGTADQNDPTKLTWDQIRTMEADGMVFGSHTYMSHYEVPGPHGMMVPVFDTRMMIDGKRETIAHYDERVFNDFMKARVELSSETGQPVIQFAWPYGWGISAATYIAHKVGYEYIYTTTNGAVTQYTSDAAIPRIDIGKPWISPEQAAFLIIHFSKVNVSVSGIMHGGVNHTTEVAIYGVADGKDKHIQHSSGSYVYGNSMDKQQSQTHPSSMLHGTVNSKNTGKSETHTSSGTSGATHSGQQEKGGTGTGSQHSAGSQAKVDSNTNQQGKTYHSVGVSDL